MRAQAADHVILVALFHFFLNFFQGEMHHVVVMQLHGRDQIAEAQPQSVQEIDFVGGQVGSVGTEHLVELVPVGHVNFQVELWLRVAKLFPGFTNKPGVLFRALSRRAPSHNSAGL